MGEFQRRIEKQKEHYEKILKGNPISMSAVRLHIDNVLAKQKQIVALAKKEFPFVKDWYKAVPMEELTMETYYEWLAKPDEWFEKWFGEEV